MRAHDLEQLLRQRHSSDIFVPQCKTGPTGTGVQIFDGWALAPSWAHPLATGYEIKVSRGDFLRDTKWRGYLPYCNEFYFVAPYGLIDKNEIPEGVGLLTACGSRLVTKKKAVYHEADAVVISNLFKYVLMYHSGLIKDGYRNKTREERIQEWETRIADKERIDRLGYRVSKKLRERISREIEDQKRENDHLSRENEKLANVQTALEGMGLDIKSMREWDLKQTLADRIAELDTGIPNSLKRTIDSARQALDRLDEALYPKEVQAESGGAA